MDWVSPSQLDISFPQIKILKMTDFASTGLSNKCSSSMMRLIYVQACGAKYHIEGELLDETDVDDVVVALVELARNVSCISSLLCYLYGFFLVQGFVICHLPFTCISLFYAIFQFPLETQMI